MKAASKNVLGIALSPLQPSPRLLRKKPGYKLNIRRRLQKISNSGRPSKNWSARDGRVVKVERDIRRSGRADLWIAYDITKEGDIILKEERDLDGDGLPDLWSHYDHGRLVRRDLNAVGLEVFSTQDDLPHPSGDIRQISHPGN